MDFTKPSTTDNYSTGFVPNLQANQTALARWLDLTQETITGTPPQYTKAYNRSTGYIQEYNSGWANLAMNITGAAGTATTAASATNSSFSTLASASEGQLIAKLTSYNDVVLFNNSTHWGIRSTGAGGDAFSYTRGTSTFQFNGNCTGNAATSSSCSGNAATVTNGVYTTGNQSIAGDKTFTGNIYSSGVVQLTRDSASNDPTGPISVTRGTASNFAYYGLTRAGSSSYKIGITTTNLFVIGTGTAGADGAITSNLLTVDSSNGNLVATGNVTAYSDKRLKTDLVKITSALDKVEQLTGYIYTRTDTKARQTGLLSQDVQAVLPEAVDDTGEYQSLAYGNLLGLIVEAIKELRQEVKALK